MMPSSAVLPAGVDKEALLTELRRLCWGAADILRAYARGEQPPHGFPKALSVDDGVSHADGVGHESDGARAHGDALERGTRFALGIETLKRDASDEIEGAA